MKTRNYIYIPMRHDSRQCQYNLLFVNNLRGGVVVHNSISGKLRNRYESRTGQCSGAAFFVPAYTAIY